MKKEDKNNKGAERKRTKTTSTVTKVDARRVGWKASHTSGSSGSCFDGQSTKGDWTGQDRKDGKDK